MIRSEVGMRMTILNIRDKIFGGYYVIQGIMKIMACMEKSGGICVVHYSVGILINEIKKVSAVGIGAFAT